MFATSASALPILPLLRRYSAHRILTYQMLIGTAILVPFAVPGLLAQDYARVTLAGWGSLGYAVVFAGIITNLLYFMAIGRVGPSRAAVYQYLQSFLAVLFAVILLGEQITLVQVLGGSSSSAASSSVGPSTGGGASLIPSTRHGAARTPRATAGGWHDPAIGAGPKSTPRARLSPPASAAEGARRDEPWSAGLAPRQRGACHDPDAGCPSAARQRPSSGARDGGPG